MQTRVLCNTWRLLRQCSPFPCCRKDHTRTRAPIDAIVIEVVQVLALRIVVASSLCVAKTACCGHVNAVLCVRYIFFPNLLLFFFLLDPNHFLASGYYLKDILHRVLPRATKHPLTHHQHHGRLMQTGSLKNRRATRLQGTYRSTARLNAGSNIPYGTSLPAQAVSQLKSKFDAAVLLLYALPAMNRPNQARVKVSAVQQQHGYLRTQHDGQQPFIRALVRHSSTEDPPPRRRARAPNTHTHTGDVQMRMLYLLRSHLCTTMPLVRTRCCTGYTLGFRITCNGIVRHPHNPHKPSHHQIDSFPSGSRHDCHFRGCFFRRWLYTDLGRIRSLLVRRWWSLSGPALGWWWWSWQPTRTL